MDRTHMIFIRNVGIESEWVKLWKENKFFFIIWHNADDVREEKKTQIYCKQMLRKILIVSSTHTRYIYIKKWRFFIIYAAAFTLLAILLKILFFSEIRIHKFFYNTQTKQAANNSVYFIKKWERIRRKWVIWMEWNHCEN